MVRSSYVHIHEVVVGSITLDVRSLEAGGGRKEMVERQMIPIRMLTADESLCFFGFGWTIMKVASRLREIILDPALTSAGAKL